MASGGGGSIGLWAPTLVHARHPYFRKPLAHWDAAFSPDGRTLALATRTSVQICDAVSLQPRRILRFERSVQLVAYSPDGTYLAAVVGGTQKPETHSQTRLFNALTGQELGRWEGTSETTFAVRFSPDGKLLATCERDHVVLLREVPSGKLRGTLRGHSGAAKGLVFLPDGTLATASWDGTIRFWDVDACKETKVWQVGIALASLDVSPDGTMLAAADGAGLAPSMLTVWDVAAGKEKVRLGGHDGHIRAVAFTRDGRGLVGVGGRNGQYGEVNFWDLSTGRLRNSHKTGQQWMGTAAVRPDGKRILSTSMGGLSLWDLAYLHPERQDQVVQTREAGCGLFARNGKLLAVGGPDGAITLWNPDTGEVAGWLKGHTKAVRALALLPDGISLLSASEDATVKRWDLVSLAETATLRGPALPVLSLAVSADGKTLATGGGDPSKPGPGELIFWNLETNAPQDRFRNRQCGLVGRL